MNSPYVFKHYKPSQNGDNQPAIFLLHGLGSNEEDLFQLVEQFNGHCHIFSLRGPITHYPGYAFYTFEEEGKPNRQVFDKVIIHTKDFILEAIEQFHLNRENIYIIGFNQGAVLAQTLLVVLGNTIRGTVVLNGFLPDFVKTDYKKLPLDKSKMFISHGEYDYVYPIKWAEESRDFFISEGVNVLYKTYPEGHGVSPDNLKDLVNFIADDMIESIH